jgi:hypothetical protein
MESTPETSNLSTIPIRRLNQTETTPKAPDPPPEQATPPLDAGATSCPRCGGKLINPESLGWCPKCRYCRTLEEDAPKVALARSAAVKSSTLGAAEFANLVAQLPRWVWVLAAGTVVIVLISLASKFILPPECLGRALWSTSQLAIGLLGLIAAQVWALINIAPEDDRLGAKDVILATRLWSLTFKRLPQMARQVWVGAWSASAMICAVLLVGGLSYWTRYYKPERIADKNLIQAVTAMAQGKASGKEFVESLEDFANKQDLTKKKEAQEENKPDKRSTLQCVVLGYNLGPEQELEELLVGTLRDDEVRYAGRVKRGFNRENSQELLSLLKPLEVATPLIPGIQITAKWVKPQIFCEVHQSGYDDEGHLKDARYHGLLKPD